MTTVAASPDADKLDTVDLQRLALVTLAVLELSSEKDVRIRRSKNGVYRIDVMYKNLRQTTHSKDTLLEAMELALHRLRMMTQPLRAAAERLRYGYPVTALALVLMLWPAWGHAAGWTCIPINSQTQQCVTTFDSTQLSDGQHIVSVVVEDAAGNTAMDSVVVVVDNTPPVLVVTSPRPVTYRGAGVTPSGTVIDVTTGVTALTATLDGLPVPIRLTGNTWTMDLITKRGSHTLVVTATDGAGNRRQQTVTFKIVGGQ